MTPQTLAVIGTVLSFLAGLAASQGLISPQTAAYIAGPDVLAFLGIVGGALVTGWALWRNRPHGLIKATADLPQVGAVIAKPATADAVQVGNVVATATEAARLPGVTA